MREDADTDVITSLPQVDDISWATLVEGEYSVFGRQVCQCLLDRPDQHQTEDAVSAFNNFI